MEKTRWPWQQAGTTPTTADLLLDLATKQTLEGLLAIQMRLELATGVPAAIYGPAGQQLPGISPTLARSAEQHLPPAKHLLAADQWPQRNGQLLAVTWGSNVQFFVTPVVVSNRTIAQVVLGPLQLFDPGQQERPADERQSAPKAKPLVGVPILSSWRTHAVAELATVIVSLYGNQITTEAEQKRQVALRQTISEQATVLLPTVGRAKPRADEGIAHLGTLAESARLPERGDSGTPPSLPTPARETLQERVRLLSSLVEAMPQAVLLCCAPDGQVLLANRAARTRWRALLGSTPGAGIPSSKRLCLEDYPPAWEGLSQALRQGVTQVQSQVAPEQPEDPSALPLLVSAFPLRAASGEISHAVAIFEDTHPLAKQAALKDAQVRRAAHDARNPLTVILSSAQLLERDLTREAAPGPARERAQSRLADIQEQARLLAKLTEQLALLGHLPGARRLPRVQPAPASSSGT